MRGESLGEHERLPAHGPDHRCSASITGGARRTLRAHDAPRSGGGSQGHSALLQHRLPPFRLAWAVATVRVLFLIDAAGYVVEITGSIAAVPGRCQAHPRKRTILLHAPA